MDHFELSLKDHISMFQITAQMLIDRKWADSFFGNISMILDPIDINPDIITTFKTPVPVRQLDGRFLLVTRTISTMEELSMDPASALGLYRINGSVLELLWGSGPPTSEISSHLLSYSIHRGRAIVHCHMDLIDEISLRFPEGPSLPPGCSWVEYFEPGSIELALATKEALMKNDTVVWKDHGPLSMTESLERCMARLIHLDAFLRELLRS